MYIETLVLEFIFKKPADLKAWNFVKKGFQYICFPWNIAKFWKPTSL